MDLSHSASNISRESFRNDPCIMVGLPRVSFIAALIGAIYARDFIIHLLGGIAAIFLMFGRARKKR